MKHFFSIFMVLCVAVIFACTAAAEYYQYTDESGNTCFTDDISEVPASQRDTLKQFESVKSDPQPARTANRPKAENQSTEIQASSDETWDGQREQRAKALEQESEALQKTFQELQERNEALQQKATDQMTSKERNAHAQKIRELNARIKRYNEREKEFSQKVEQFNAQNQQPSAEKAKQ